ncbi:MAG: HD domain-containing protein [Fimbriimonadaceae bacterium]|nr:HD domain-containing protein [Fimbriimonadaceae bacterium]
MAEKGNPEHSNRFRAWFIGLFAFAVVAIVGLGALYLQFAASRDAMTGVIREEMERVAHNASQRIPGDKLAKLQAHPDARSSTYLELNAKLAEFLSAHPDIRYVYTVAKTDSGFQFVLDPTEPGDSDGDGVDDKSYLGDPVEQVSPGLLAASQTGSTASDTETSTDAWGTWLSAYAPIKDSEGNTIGFVGVDLPADSVIARQEPLLAQLKSTAIVVVVIAMLFGFGIASSIRKQQSDQLAEIFARLKPRAIEIGLICATLVAFLLASFAYLSLTQANQTSRASAKRLAILNSAERASEAIIRNEFGFDFGTAIEDLQTSGDETLGKKISALRTMMDSDPELAKKEARVTLNLISDEKGKQTNLWNEATSKAGGAIGMICVSLIVGFALAVTSIVALRFASTQSQKIKAVEKSTANVSENYRTLVESMPIGVVNFKDGRIAFSNNDWTSRLLSTYSSIGAGPPTAIELEIQRVITGLTNAEARRQPWSTIVQANHDGMNREIDVRATPIFDTNGAYLHLLTFFVDVTDLRETARNLEFKNRELEDKGELLQQALEQLEGNFESIVRALVRAVEAKDPYTAGHSERVMQYALWCAEELDLGPYERRILEMGCLVHDIGKIGIPDSVLTKPGHLTDEEFALIRKHPEYGAAIVRNVELFRECLPIILWHHERLDGTGYPDKLKDDEIPFLVRIASIADVFDAMTSTRSYRVGMPLEKVMRIIEEDTQKGHFDPEVYEAFKRVVARHGVIEQNDFESPFVDAA